MNKGSKVPSTQEINELLSQYSSNNVEFLGIKDYSNKNALAEVIKNSSRQVNDIRKIPKALKNKPINPDYWDPKEDIFNAKFGAVELCKDGQLDEAVWLIFLHTHFGDEEDCGGGGGCTPTPSGSSNLLKGVYGSFGLKPVWTFEEFKSEHENFLSTPHMTKENIKGLGKFSNHRKRETYDPEAIYRVLREYKEKFLNPYENFSEMIEKIEDEIKRNPTEYFKHLYNRLDQTKYHIYRFGRLAIFDFLAMLGNLEIIPIEPDSVHLKGSSGPLFGANALINGDKSKKKFKVDEVLNLEEKIDKLDKELNFGKQVLEDSICIWQKKFPYTN